MPLPSHITDCVAASSCYVGEATYERVASFILGYDVATFGGALLGFKEWLLTRLGYGWNLGWPELVLYLAFPDAENRRDLLADLKDDQRAINVLGELLKQFSSDRDEQNGLARIYAKYHERLLQESWYTPECPGWIAAENTPQGGTG